MNPYKLIVLVFSLAVFLTRSHAQNSKSNLLSGNFDHLSLDKFVDQLERTTGYHFYYDKDQFDSLRVTLQVDRKSLPEVLEKAFDHTSFQFAIDHDRRFVFLTRDYAIRTDLPAGLIFDDSSDPDFGKDRPTAIARLYSGEHNAVQNAVLENKLYEVGLKANAKRTGNVTLSGRVYNKNTGEAVPKAIIQVEGTVTRSVAGQNGFYSFELPPGEYLLIVKALGMKDAKRRVMIHSDGKLNIYVQENVMSLNEVVVSAKRSENVNRTQLGVEKLDIKAIKQVPTVFGEADILKVVLTLPGVQSVGEASTGLNVRGGSTDQNLILFNDATIFNPSHFFGFFSAFNPDVVQDIELYKSTIPAQYGGRLSSVLDISAREGSKEEFKGTAGLGLLTSRLNIEGPVIKDKSSFLLGARTTYSNWLLQILPRKSGYRDSKASFSDLNLNLSHHINKNNELFFTGYLSRDLSNLNTDTLFRYNNTNVSLKWKHTFNQSFSGRFTSGLDQYAYSNYNKKNPLNAYQLDFNINQLNLKADFKYALSPDNILDFGLSSIYYRLNPGTFTPKGAESLIEPNLMEREQAIESAVYLNDTYNVAPWFSLNTGVRFSRYSFLGPKSINTYGPGSKEESNITDTLYYGKGSSIKTYQGPEFRISARFNISPDFSIKAGYNTMRQYIHMLSNTTAIAPTDIWKLSDPNIRPQHGHQVSVGVYKNFRKNTIETSLEVYQKKLKDYLDYKSGALLLLNPHIETDVINTRGRAYGAEFMIKKQTGKFNGWMSYTYSRILLKTDNPAAGELVNQGQEYPANYDKPHSFNFTGNFKFSHRFSVSLNTTYSTGRPITIPIAKYNYGNSQRVFYSNRNQYRIPDYFRTDLSMNIEGNHYLKQLTHNSWTIGVYNLTGRKNAYSTYFTSEGGAINSYKLTIFGNPIPFVNYNIRF